MEWDRDSVHKKPATLKERVESCIGAHNACALATVYADMVRNTPSEYNDEKCCFYSEGGLKFMRLM